MSPHTQTEIRLSGSSMVFQGALCLSPSGQDLRFQQAPVKLKNPNLNQAQKFLGRRSLPGELCHWDEQT